MAKFGDRIKAWWRGAGSGDAALVGARGVSQGSPDALRVISPAETGPVVAPVEMGNSLVNGLGAALNMGTDLLSKYIDIELMDEYDYLSAALDVYADDATVQDVQRKRIVWGTGNDRLARGMVDDLLHRRLKIEEDAWAIVRTMSKYGNACGEILADARGVRGINYLPPASMRKVLDGRGACIGYVQAVTAAAFTTVTSENFAKLLAERGDGPNKDGIVVFHPWEIVWWQMPGKQVRAPYGESVLAAARWAWKRLVMLEDAAVQFRLSKAPSRYLIGVECGTIEDKKIPGYLNMVKQKFKKTRVVDPVTGQLDFRPNPTALDEDFFVAMRDGQKLTDIEVLNGPDFNIIDDLEYFQKKMMQATHVPKGYVDSGEVTRAALSQADVAFARTEMRVQQRFLAGLRQVQRLHFALLGVDPDEVDVGMDMAVPSSILEMSQVEAGNARAALAAACADFLDRRTILVQVLGYSEAEAEAILRARKADYQAQVGLEAAGQAAMMGAAPGAEGAEGSEGVGPVPGAETEPEEMQSAKEELAMRRMARLMASGVDRSVQDLSEDVARLGRAVRRADDNVRRLPRVVQRALAAGGRRGRE